MPFKILVADDKIDDRGEEISELPELLRKAGYEVKTAADEEETWNLVWEYQPDLIVLDVAFRDHPTYGIEVCEAIRLEGNETPIILVTAVRKETETVLAGLKAGADDYVRRPQGNREIIARIRNNLPPETVVVDDYLRIDFAHRRVWVHRDKDWCEVPLPRRLWKLFEVLAVNAGLIVPTTSIKDRIWNKIVGDGALSKAVYDLRQKVEPDPDHPLYIEVARGIGYRFSGTLVRVGSASPMGHKHGCPGARPAPSLERNKNSSTTEVDSLKAQLMAHAEQVIDRLLDQKGSQEALPPGAVEQLVRAAGQDVVDRFTSVLAGQEGKGA